MSTLYVTLYMAKFKRSLKTALTLKQEVQETGLKSYRIGCGHQLTARFRFAWLSVEVYWHTGPSVTITAFKRSTIDKWCFPVRILVPNSKLCLLKSAWVQEHAYTIDKWCFPVRILVPNSKLCHLKSAWAQKHAYMVYMVCKLSEYAALHLVYPASTFELCHIQEVYMGCMPSPPTGLISPWCHQIHKCQCMCGTHMWLW